MASLRWRTRCSLAMFAGVLLGVAFTWGELGLLIWIAWVPLLVALQDATLEESYWLGLYSGLVCHLIGANWIVDFVMLFKGYDRHTSILTGVLFWLFSAQLLALLSLCLQWCRRYSQCHDLLLFPLLLAIFYNEFPMLFSCQPGETQGLFPLVIQATDVVGTAGLDVVIGLVNVLLFEIVRQQKRRARIWMPALAIVAMWFGYGAWALPHWQQLQSQWAHMTIGIVQPNERPSLGTFHPLPGYALVEPPEMAMTRRLVAVGAQWVMWPETRYKGYFDHPQVAAAYRAQVAEIGTPLLLQDMEQVTRSPTEPQQLFNSAVLLQADGTPQATYRKVKRVAFGEYLPWLATVPWLKSVVENFFGEFSNTVTPGTGAVIYHIDDVSIIPLICYEVMFAEYVAEAVPTQAGGHVLAVMSSNGWFGSSLQPLQHIHAGVLRAVENRLPLIHVLNNGPSVTVMPDGTIKQIAPLGVGGGFVATLPYSRIEGGSFFSSHPWWVRRLLLVCLLLVLADMLLRRWKFPLRQKLRQF